jgi:hypothetical protein
LSVILSNILQSLQTNGLKNSSLIMYLFC